METLDKTANIKEHFSELIFHLRDHGSKVEDSRGRSLFKISAKVIARLQKAFNEYEERLMRLSVN
jgi:hypothetical protein